MRFHKYDSQPGLIIIAIIMILQASCESFFDPPQGLIVKEEDFFQDWNEYRSAEMGLYSLQQELVSQIVVLGDLRGDLLDITPNAERDLIEIYNFEISPDNSYASPQPFYQLIGACNSLAVKLEFDYPEVLDPASDVTIYDRLYGEVLCMRAWAYFNAVRIYGTVPYIWPSLKTIESIEEYINTGNTVIDTMRIIYSPNGYDNDTIYNDTVNLDRIYLDMHAIVDTFTHQLEDRIKAVGVIHNMINEDPTWDVTIWNEFAMHCLLGQMYLYEGNLGKAVTHFGRIMYYQMYNELDGTKIRYGLDSKFENFRWKNIFLGIDIDEHILTLWFNKSYQQQNDLQLLFSQEAPNQYMLKPSSVAVSYWETIWRGTQIDRNAENPNLTILEEPGDPGDFYRGHGVSFGYFRDGIMLDNEEVQQMLYYKKIRNDKFVREIMQDVDTVVYKYTLGKNSFDRDANFPVFRAAGIHLYYAEIFARWSFDHDGVIRPETNLSLNVLNDGTYDDDSRQKGVRGRVGFGSGDDAIRVDNIIYIHDPETNEILGYYDYTNNLTAKQYYLEDRIMEERARELAFEGERFYDLIRIAKRRGDPSYLADRVASKFSGAKAEQIRQYLMDEQNWYIHPW